MMTWTRFPGSLSRIAGGAHRAVVTAVVGIIGCLSWSGHAEAGSRRWDFTKGDLGWGANRDMEVKEGARGLAYTCHGEDPWLEGPVLEATLTGRPAWFRVRLRSTANGWGEVFHGARFSPSRSVRFPIHHDGGWREYEIALPELEPGSRLRIDPGSGPGEGEIAWIEIEPFELLPPADLPTPRWADPGAVTTGGIVLDAGDGVAIVPGPGDWPDFRIEVGGNEVAAAHPGTRIGIVGNDGAAWYLDPAGAPPDIRATPDGGWTSKLELVDRDGVRWTLMREAAAVVGHPGAAEIEVRIECDRERRLFHLPMVDLIAWPGGGAGKTQALLPGVEYLADEPSSSEADVRGAKAERRIVDDLKLTSPMMIVVKDGRWVALAWDRGDHPAPVFDSPDRMFGSGGHLMGLWFPGVGRARSENALAVREPFVLREGEPLKFRFRIAAGTGDSIVPAVRRMVGMSGIPPVPDVPDGSGGALRLMAAGWLDSAAREGSRWRHAVWGDRFGAAPAADAVAFLWWLADAVPGDDPLAGRLSGAAAAGMEEFASGDPLLSVVGHVQRPLAPLLFGDIGRAIEARAEHAWGILRSFDARGVVPYRRRGGDGPDYAATNPRDHESGTTGLALVRVLEAALLAGDEALAAGGLERLGGALEVYRNDVPRGAQTWEMPLHTPDVLAAAHMVRACVLAFHLSADPAWLGEAEYWAWAGVPFIYLDPPVGSDRTGAYAVISVFGATNWEAPFWIGLPVQWCGLVYRSALLDLAAARGDGDDPSARFWRQLANGITASGLRQTFPLDDAERRGLLPDFFHLREQVPDGPAINPGTVQAGLPELLGRGRIYDERSAGAEGPVMIAPGSIDQLVYRAGTLTATLDAWPKRPFRIVINRVAGRPDRITWKADGHEARTLDPNAWRHDPERRRLVVELETGEKGTLTADFQ